MISAVTQDNTERLHHAIGNITPADRLAGRSDAIWATCEERLEAARAARRLAQQAFATSHQGKPSPRFHSSSTHV